MTACQPVEWDLHYLRVVIEDGYPDVHVGEDIDWFADFETHALLTPSANKTKSAVPLSNGYYLITAEVIYISHETNQEACLLDFGIKAISEAGGVLGIPLPLGCKEGDYVNGEIRLSIPLCTVIHPFNISYRGRVNHIFAHLNKFHGYPGDISPVHYQEVSGTDTLRADVYVLRCSTLSP